MSHIGKKLITVPDGVTVEKIATTLKVTGPKGSLTVTVGPAVDVRIADKTITISVRLNAKRDSSLHGLYRSLIANAIVGVSQGFTKTLEMKGTGYRAEVQDNTLTLLVGFSHPVTMALPQGITAQVERNTIITVSGIDKQLVGHVAAKIRAVRRPEPYKGKGIRYSDEVIKRKAGKAAKATAGAS
ncbi:50S ribosomal protein L6 [Candidatus Berkelbacteria bacterium]|nr:50S ribosomal protein L6 [Candidatus Berkelbacteria bacterium]